MTQGRKKMLSETGDYNWDLERMQYEKDRRHILGKEQDYVNKKTKEDVFCNGKGA